MLNNCFKVHPTKTFSVAKWKTAWMHFIQDLQYQLMEPLVNICLILKVDVLVDANVTDKNVATETHSDWKYLCVHCRLLQLNWFWKQLMKATYHSVIVQNTVHSHINENQRLTYRVDDHLHSDSEWIWYFN